MIKNERQYLITKKQAENFERALYSLENRPEGADSIHPRLKQAEADGLRSQLADLKSELREYEETKAGQRPVLQLHGIEDLPHALITARIAANLTQQDLAEQLEMKPQQVQRYEATDYAGASLSTLVSVARVLGIGIREDVLLPTVKATPRFLLSRLATIGIDHELLIWRLLPPKLRMLFEGEQQEAEAPSASQALQIASLIERVFGIDPVTLFSSATLGVDGRAIAGARLKAGIAADQERLTAYAAYAAFLARLVLKATDQLASQPIPTDPLQIHAEIISRYGSMSFESALRYVWSVGIPVLPLQDPGAFHGAVWRHNGRNVIVLKQRTRSSARWLVDLLHEFKHASEEPEQLEFSLIEPDEDPRARRDAERERVATHFAGEIALGGRAEELAQQCAREAGGRVERLKQVVQSVAARKGVPVDILANYLAFRLTFEEPPVNWWGTAENLQSVNQDPWVTARDVLLRHVDFSVLDRTDQGLISRALDD